MKIFVTGGTGFIGSYVLNELLDTGHKVIALRRPGSNPVISLLKQPKWIEKKLLEITTKDLEEIEVVYHLASAGVSPQKATWKELQEINVASGLHLIEASYNSKVKRFIAAGSCMEYGSEAKCWDRIPAGAKLSPITPYGSSKASGFLLLKAFASNYPIEFFYGRIFSAYGQGQYKKNLWPSLHAAAVSGNDFQMSTGEQIRDFIQVREVAKHFRVAAERKDIKPLKPLIVNIGSGKPIRVIDFAHNEWERLGGIGKLQPGKISPRSNESERMVADISGIENIATSQES